MTGHLAVISGVPGVRKTSVAQIVAVRTGSVHLSIDAVEESIPARGLPRGWRVGVAAYEAVAAVRVGTAGARRDARVAVLA